ncbi:MAG TPA: hypothetical protein VJ947_06455 [Pseudohaliea sp.]|nr:hypothetical protein [Pseudohaliea sp.]HKL62521.1 hypothetical protein [Woeseiaceae bacterium]
MNLEHALADPSSEFESPEAVLTREDLTQEQKKAILERWRQDAELLQQAEAENMAGGEPNLLDRVQQALARL